METRLRSIVKSLTWRVTALIVTTSVVWVVTGKPVLAFSIGAMDTLVKLGTYYAHERLWVKVRFGRKPPSEYEI
jgi:uncharacterized membrane protein